MRNLSGGAALIAALATVVLTGCSGADDAPEAASSSDSPSASPSASGSAAAESTPAYGSPAAPSASEPPAVATDPQPSPPPAGTTASVRVTYADWNADARVVEAGGILTDVVEADGVCTLTLSKDDASVTATVEGLPDARSTNCGGLVVAGEGLSAGTWTAVISYRSARTVGASEPASVLIP